MQRQTDWRNIYHGKEVCSEINLPERMPDCGCIDNRRPGASGNYHGSDISRGKLQIIHQKAIFTKYYKIYHKSH